MPPRSPRLLRLIALFKLLKAVALLVSLAIVLNLFRHDPTQAVIGWALKLHVDPGNRYLLAVLAKILDINAHQLELLAAGTVLYAALFAIEGVGLLADMVWAEYLTIVETAGFIPLEVYEIVEQVSALRGVVLAFNVTIVVYLIVLVRRKRHRR